MGSKISILWTFGHKNFERYYALKVPVCIMQIISSPALKPEHIERHLPYRMFGRYSSLLCHEQ